MTHWRNHQIVVVAACSSGLAHARETNHEVVSLHVNSIHKRWGAPEIVNQILKDCVPETREGNKGNKSDVIKKLENQVQSNYRYQLHWKTGRKYLSLIHI